MDYYCFTEFKRREKGRKVLRASKKNEREIKCKKHKQQGPKVKYCRGKKIADQKGKEGEFKRAGDTEAERRHERQTKIKRKEEKQKGD